MGKIINYDTKIFLFKLVTIATIAVSSNKGLGGFPMVKRVIGRCLLGILLKRKRMSQEELSIITGIHKSQISEYIANKRKMSLNNARLIAKALGCHIDDLYDWLL